MVWGFARETPLKQVQVLQKRALRIITFSDFKQPASPLLSKFKILNLADTIKIKQLEFMYDWVHGALPTVFKHQFQYQERTKKTRSGVTKTLLVPRVKTKAYGSSCMRTKGASLLNQMTLANISFHKSKNLFKKEIKQLLLSSYT